MTNIQRVGMINSNNTQRNSDHDFTKLRKRALGNQGGVESKEQFIFDKDTKKLSAGSDIATAYILCTRPASNPIPNQKFLAQFEFTGSLDFLNITNGDKIFIEIKEKLVKDPTLIEDLDSQTNYNQGLGIGEIKIAKNYPSHSNYLKLYEWNEGKLVDLRKAISLPALDSVSQRTTTLEEKMTTAEGQITQLVEAGTPSYLSKMLVVGGTYQEGDVLFEKDGKAYPTTIRLTRPDVHHTKPISTYTPLFELDIPEGKDFKMIIEEGWSDNEVYLTIGSAYSAGYADNTKYGHISGIKSKKKYEALLSEDVSGQKIYVTVNKDRYTSNFLHLQGIKIVGKIGTDEVILYPRAIKSIGEKVECTILGLHTDGNCIGIGRRVPINKSIEGLATAEWTAPANGLLEYQYYTENNYSLLNGKIMPQGRAGDLPHYIYVKYGDIIRISVDNRGRNGTYKTTLLSFIPL